MSLSKILHLLNLAPHSLAEMCDSLALRTADHRKRVQVRLLLSALLADGRVVVLPGRDDDGKPVYALHDWKEPAGWNGDHDELRLGRDYSGLYEGPRWRADV